MQWRWEPVCGGQKSDVETRRLLQVLISLPWQATGRRIAGLKSVWGWDQWGWSLWIEKTQKFYILKKTL